MSNSAIALPSSPAITPAHAIDALYALAHAFLEQERIDDATRAFRVLVRIAPTDERGWLGLGACHERREQDEIACELYGAGSLVTIPRSGRCLVALSRIERRNGDADSADEHVDEALALSEDQEDEALVALVLIEKRANARGREPGRIQ